MLSAVGAAMATPAPVYGILHKVQDSYVRLSDKFSNVSTKRLTTLSGAIAFGLMAATHSIHETNQSIKETNQSELHTARVEACGGAHAGKISFRYKGADSFVDCATMMTPTQQP